MNSKVFQTTFVAIAMILTVLNVYKRFYTNKVCTKSLLGKTQIFLQIFS